MSQNFNVHGGSVEIGASLSGAFEVVFSGAGVSHRLSCVAPDLSSLPDATARAQAVADTINASAGLMGFDFGSGVAARGAHGYLWIVFSFPSSPQINSVHIETAPGVPSAGPEGDMGNWDIALFDTLSVPTTLGPEALAEAFNNGVALALSAVS